MGDLDKFKKDYILFLEAGFIAVNQADEDSALKLFRATELLKPDILLPKVGIGYLHLHKLELKQAQKIFEEVLQADPSNDMARTFLGICLSLSPTETAKGEKILEDTRKSTHDSQVKKVANTTLEFVDQFVKKAASPVEVQKKEKKAK